MSTNTKSRHTLPGDVCFAALPGPSRKRTPSPYCFRLLHVSPDSSEVGCLLQWEVLGGREIYQVALEREASGRLRWHCTCPDSVFRGERSAHQCKHIRGVQSIGRDEELTVPVD